MKHTRLIAFSAMVALMGPVGGFAQTPAELPPEAFAGNQYVDSQGCVFTRAGIDGTVTWVPRMNPDRTQVCDQPPTFAAAETPEPEEAETLLTVTTDAEEAPMPTVAGTVTDAPAPSAAPAAMAAAPAPRPRAAAPRAPEPVQVAQVDNRRLLPAHLVERRTAALLVRVPRGYERVWEDGRLNPRRGEQSVNGYTQSQSTMSLTVPRRDVGGTGPVTVVEPRIRSNTPVQTSSVRVEFADNGRTADLSAADRR